LNKDLIAAAVVAAGVITVVVAACIATGVAA
jgi:hypothetical protein